MVHCKEYEARMKKEPPKKYKCEFIYEAKLATKLIASSPCEARAIIKKLFYEPKVEAIDSFIRDFFVLKRTGLH